jgi:hypothetical protein
MPATPQEKAKKANRLQKDQNAIQKQLKVAKAHGSAEKYLKEPNRLSKHHAMDCGNPECYLCGNPRKTHKDKLTAQEKRLFQDTEAVRDKNSNGAAKSDE